MSNFGDADGMPTPEEVFSLPSYNIRNDETDRPTNYQYNNGHSNGNGNANGGIGKRGLPKLREILRRQKQDSEDEDSPDIDFTYADEDDFSSEIAELYSYTEMPEFGLAHKAFEDSAKRFKLPLTWGGMSLEQKNCFIQLLLDLVDVSCRHERLTASRALLYIGQGCWLECQCDSECYDQCRQNVTLLYKNGVFGAFIELLNLEIENGVAAMNASRKLAVNLGDSVDLRVILSLLYTITIVMRLHSDNLLRENFVQELNTPMESDELFAIRLLTMVTRFCSGSAPHFPMKKVLLLLWKVLLTSLGGMEALKELKAKYRKEANLSDILEDTLTVARTMRAASPPASAAEALEASSGNRKYNRPGIKRSMMAKQNSLDDVGLELEGDDQDDDFEDSNNESSSEGTVDDFGRDSPRPGSPMPAKEPAQPRNLPWTPKVHMRDLDAFLDQTRMKFVGFVLKNDRTTLAGLPPPIHEGVKILKNHMYRSLADLQIEAEEDISNNPLSKPEGPVLATPSEILYATMLPSLPQYMIALLKILLAAAPTSKAKTESINIITDVLPEEMPIPVVESMKLGIDVNRHKEIIVKSVSAILLLLLKHFKINHIYQFEFMSQHLVFANCIPLVLKFFNQNIMAYIASKNNIALLDFPSCVIGEQPEMTPETLEIGDTSLNCWRNCFSCINLLRVLNKLTKWKHSRIMMLVVFKSAPILKRTLKVKHATMQLYVLKLLKMQTKYLGRQWRKSNMKTMSAIYTKVRHRLNDDWAYGNDVESRPWDFQAEECLLRGAVDRFNHRRYGRPAIAVPNPSNGNANDQNQSANASEKFEYDYEPVDNCINSVLNQEVELTDEFKAHYEKWLEMEVYNSEIRWELLLDPTASDSL